MLTWLPVTMKTGDSTQAWQPDRVLIHSLFWVSQDSLRSTGRDFSCYTENCLPSNNISSNYVKFASFKNILEKCMYFFLITIITGTNIVV